jgi:pimeloyl-ACP methyl ester carboxylesterase
MTRILYLHGFASGPSSSKARYFRERLEGSEAHVEVPDLAGGDFDHLTITGQLGVVERCAEGQPVSLVGSSLGGYVSALYAARHPEVSRVVLLAPAFGFARRWAEYLGAAEVAEWQRTGHMDVFHYGENRMRKLSCRLLEDAAGYEEFPDFGQPSLIFHGARDDVVPVAYSQEFAAAHPNARLEILDSDHELLDVLDYMASEVVAFLTA